MSPATYELMNEKICSQKAQKYKMKDSNISYKGIFVSPVTLSLY